MKPLSSFLIAVSTVVIAQTAQAEQLIEVTDGGVITGTVSAGGVTRVSFIGDQAASVQLAQGGNGPGFSIAHEPTTGDLYLTLARDPRRGEAQGAASFFVTTSQGFTYQVELAAREIPSTQIQIRNPELHLKTTQMEMAQTPVIDQVVNLNRAMWNGALMEGYQLKRPLRRERAAGALRLTPVAVYDGPELTGRVLEIRNPSPGSIELSEDVFMAPGVVSVVIKGPRSLGADDRSSVLIIDQGGPS
ncbi:MAG: type-F conjugative transfer system secretin TraK [Pseudomonadota bacterium]